MKANRYDMTPIASTYGNSATHDSGVTLAAAAIGTVVDIVELPPGTRITDLKLVNAALGADTTVRVGYRYVDPDDGDAVDNYFLAAASSVSDGHRYTPAPPIQFEVPVIITLTTGGGVATGRVDVIPTYAFMGTK